MGTASRGFAHAVKRRDRTAWAKAQETLYMLRARSCAFAHPTCDRNRSKSAPGNNKPQTIRQFLRASATVAVLGQRPCEFQWRRCKAMDRHYVVERVNYVS